jgi:hypothetical protein
MAPRAKSLARGDHEPCPGSAAGAGWACRWQFATPLGRRQGAAGSLEAVAMCSQNHIGLCYPPGAATTCATRRSRRAAGEVAKRQAAPKMLGHHPDRPPAA